MAPRIVAARHDCMTTAVAPGGWLHEVQRKMRLLPDEPAVWTSEGTAVMSSERNGLNVENNVPYDNMS